MAFAGSLTVRRGPTARVSYEPERRREDITTESTESHLETSFLCVLYVLCGEDRVVVKEF